MSRLATARHKKPSAGIGQCRQRQPRTRPRAGRCSTTRRSGRPSIRSSSSRSSSSWSIEAATNAVENLQRRAHRLRASASSNNTAGFDISQTLIPFSAAGSTYGDAFIVGLLNTLVVAVDRHRPRDDPRLHHRHRAPVEELDRRARLATVYVEVIRNMPLLLQLLFWYIRGPRRRCRSRASRSSFGAGFFLNNARPVHAEAAPRGGRLGDPAAAFAARPRRHDRVPDLGAAAAGGRPAGSIPSASTALGPHRRAAGAGLARARPRRQRTRSPSTSRAERFNLRGGMQLCPEFVALLLGLVIYTAAFIAEVVRAGILAVSQGPDRGGRRRSACARARRCASS